MLTNDTTSQPFFLYARKSTESEDRQVRSIADQLSALDGLAAAQGLAIVARFEEMRSAKLPENRPLFADMLRRIEAGEASGIIVWHPDRLSRNAVDTGKLVYLMDQGKLREIQMPGQVFRNTPHEKFLLTLLCGQAKLENDNKSINVKRGVRSKFERGELPGRAPVGYDNDRATKLVTRDPERFESIREAWQLMLTGAYTVPQVWRWLNARGFTTIKRKGSGGRPLALSALYRIFEDPFYAGMVRRYGEMRPGKHEAMVSPGQFALVQGLLGRRGTSGSTRHAFTYAQLFRCGECGHAITADEKTKTLRRTGEVKTYVYYHCSHHRYLTPCSQRRHIPEAVLGETIHSELQRYTIHREFYDFALRCLDRYEAANSDTDTERIRLEQDLRSAERQQLILTQLRYREQISEGAFEDERRSLGNKTASLHQLLRTLPTNEHRLARLRAAFLRQLDLADRFENGSPEIRKRLLADMCSNRTIHNKKPAFGGQELLTEVVDLAETQAAATALIEPLKAPVKSRRKGASKAQISAWQRTVDKIIHRFMALPEVHAEKPKRARPQKAA